MGASMRAIRGGTLIDGTGATPLKDSVIVIEGSKIVEVGREGQVRVPSGAEVIEAGGKIVMPGLIDCHTHISSISTASPGTGWGALEYSLSDRVVMSVVAAKKLLEAGITTIRNLGDPGSNIHIDIAVRDAIKRGDVVGPRIFASDSGITMIGGHADMLKSVRAIAFDREALGYGIVNGVIDCIKVVREHVRVGADLIKIWATGGVMEATERAGMQELSNEEIRAIVDESAKSGRYVAAHAVGPPESIKFCSETGVRSIDHGIFNNEESINMMREKGTFLVPTLIAYQLLTGDVFPAVTREVAERAVTAHEKTLKAAKKAGVKVAMGTDSGAPYGSIHGKVQAWEIELMATRGLTPMESIVAATKTGAECIGVGEKTGTIEPGKFADLLIIEGNPLDDIKVLQNLNRIKVVMKEGASYITRP
jgi:imidazolonepropionase-like amidohydrolase